MSENKEPIDHQRYFNDPEYRKSVLAERKKKEADQKSSNEDSNFSNTKKKILVWVGSFAGVALLAAIGYLIFLIQGLPPPKN